MGPAFQPHPRDPQGILDAVLIVHNVALREDVDELLIDRHAHGLRGVQNALDVVLGHLRAANRHGPWLL